MITDILKHLPAKFGSCTRFVTISVIFDPNRPDYYEQEIVRIKMRIAIPRNHLKLWPCGLPVALLVYVMKHFIYCMLQLIAPLIPYLRIGLFDVFLAYQTQSKKSPLEFQTLPSLWPSGKTY